MTVKLDNGSSRRGNKLGQNTVRYGRCIEYDVFGVLVPALPK